MKAGETAEDLEPNGKFSELHVTSQTDMSVGILPFFSASVSQSTSIQLLVQDVAHQNALGALDPAKLTAAKQETMPAGACDRRVITSAVLTEAISKVYREVGRDASAQGFNIKIGGRWHNSTLEFERALYLHIETRAP